MHFVTDEPQINPRQSTVYSAAHKHNVLLPERSPIWKLQGLCRSEETRIHASRLPRDTKHTLNVHVLTLFFFQMFFFFLLGSHNSG